MSSFKRFGQTSWMKKEVGVHEDVAQLLTMTDEGELGVEDVSQVKRKREILEEKDGRRTRWIERD